MSLRQACAVGDVERARELQAEIQSMQEVDSSTQWLAAQTMGYYDLAHTYLAPLDTPEQMIGLSSFLTYYHFDIDRYPNLKAVLEAQGITRPAPVPVLFGCQQWGAGQ